MFRIRKKRIVLILILLAIVVFYATVFLGISFQSTPKTVKFSSFKAKQVQLRFSPDVKPQAQPKKNGFKSFPSETKISSHEVNSADKRIKVEFMEQTKEKELNFSEKDKRLLSKYSASHGEGEYLIPTVIQKPVSGDRNVETYNKTTDEDKLSSPFEENDINQSQIAIENADIRRGFDGKNASYCHLPFKYGQMCPKSYTQLGGICRMFNKSAFYCPDIRFRADNPHRQGQLITTRMLKIFDLVCKKHNISYWLTGGTLLGAARHKGNIPWDTDNDVEITLQDYIKFFQTAAKDLPEDVFFQNSISDPALGPSNPAEKAALAHDVVGLYRRSWNPRLRDPKSCYRYCIKEGCSWHDGMMIDIFVQETKDPGIFPLKQMEFEGFLFPVPNNWRSQLEKLYHSNFLQVPEKEKNRKPVDFPDTQHSCDELKVTGYFWKYVKNFFQTIMFLK